MQKARRHPTWGLRPLAGARFQGLFHSAVRGAFHLSLTVLCAIGLPGVLSLGGWCRRIRTGLLRPRPTQGTGSVGPHFAYGAVTRSGPPFQARSAMWSSSFVPGAVPLSLAATRGVTVVFLSSDYWDVSVRRVRLPIRGCRACARRVAPFGHPRIWGCSRLPAVFRGLPRPSSPPGAKASSVRPRSLLALREFPRRARAPAGSLSFVVSFSLCVCFPSNPVKEPCGSGIAAVSRRSGECGARTHDPRLAKPVL